jgi:phage N-6-adenine-methyltransferase
MPGDKYITPPEFLARLNTEFQFDFDPCPISWKPGDVDGLAVDWGNSTFCNPPYSNVKPWIKKAHEEWKKGKTVVMLINAITDTKAFHQYIYGQAELRFIEGRLSFIDPDKPEKRTPNVKPSMVVIFRGK